MQIRLCLAIIAATLITPLDGVAQEKRAQDEGSGVVFRAQWPDYVYETQGSMSDPGAQAAEDFSDLSILPFLDSLVVAYEYRVEDGRPYAAFDLRWVPGDRGVLDGRVVPAADLPADLRLSKISLRVVAESGDSEGADMVLMLDSLSLLPSPAEYSFETTAANWADFFANPDSVAARAVFRNGFRFSDLTVLSIGFEANEESPSAPGGKVRVARRAPPRRTVWTPDVNIWIGWTSGHDPYRVRPRAPSPRRARGGDMGRNLAEGRAERSAPRSSEEPGQRASAPQAGLNPGADSRSGSRENPGGTTPADQETDQGTGATRGDTRQTGAAAAPAKEGEGERASPRWNPVGKKKSDDEKDDDDDRDLLGPALAGAAAVGALIYFGGTVGWYSHGEAPIGLLAGRAGPRGGALLQVAVNADLITAGDDEAMLAVATAVLPPVAGRLHPTLGFGAWLGESHDEIEVLGTVQFGALYRTGAFRLMGAWDARRGGASVGLAYQFRGENR